MKILRPRASRTKILKGLTAKGGVYYYSKKPSGRRADYVDSKAKENAKVKEPSVRIKKKQG